MDSLPDFAGMTKNGDSDGAQARSVGPESGPQGEGGEVRPVWTRKGKFCARLGRLGEVFGPLKVRAVKVLRLETRGEGGREDGLGVGQKLQETDRASRKVP